MGARYEKQAGEGGAKRLCGETGEKGEKSKIESRKSKVITTL
jgi:hypothetical protein